MVSPHSPSPRYGGPRSSSRGLRMPRRRPPRCIQASKETLANISLQRYLCIMSERDETPKLHEAVLDAAALRALAHPLRIRILDELSAYGPLTATGLADRLGESSGATSYHLRQLEKHDLVREVKGRGTARERWWERRPGGIATPDARVFAPGSAERLATQLITNEWERGRQQNYHEFLAEGEGAFGREWIDAATSDTVNLRLTADELRAVARDVEVVVQGY